MFSDTCTQVFQESPGVPPTPQLVLPLQDCCAFWLVLLCTKSTVEVASRRVAAAIAECLQHTSHIHTAINYIILRREITLHLVRNVTWSTNLSSVSTTIFHVEEPYRPQSRNSEFQRWHSIHPIR